MTGRKSETREEGLGTREGGAGERKREGRLHFRSISFAVVALFLSLLFSLFSSPLFLSFSSLFSFFPTTRFFRREDACYDHLLAVIFADRRANFLLSRVYMQLLASKFSIERFDPLFQRATCCFPV